MAKSEGEWKSTACILCTLNCGVQVQLSDDGTEIARTRGDENHPASKGYLCNKASRLNYYQNKSNRLTTPMRRTVSGEYEPIDWNTAISEVAARFARVRDEHGGASIFYHGGGGQGNHLPGAYGRMTRAALGVKYSSNALAQEKTGEFWVADRMFGGWPHGDFDNAKVVVFLGKNPWHSHGVHRARALIREISKDPERTLIVIDPKRTETADLADIHLQVKPGRDAWLLAGMIATLVQEQLVNKPWLTEHANGLEEIAAVFNDTDIADCGAKCGIDEAVIRSTARLFASAESLSLLEDLGVQMNRHSTLVSYLQRLVWVLCGHFARPGTHATANGLTNFGSGRESSGTSPVVGARLITDLVPCNVIPEEILTDHPDRYRAMIIESSNPVHSLADSQKWRAAMRALDVSVVIDVAMTETAREADYILPATSQFEKAEATFFNFEFPNNYFQVRAPLFTPTEGPLDEAEIHIRLVQALGVWPSNEEAALRDALDQGGRKAFREAVFASLARNPGLSAMAPGLLYRTLGDDLPKGMRNASVLWALCHEHAVKHADSVKASGIKGEGMELGDALFDAIIDSPSGLITSTEQWEDVWKRVPGGKVQLGLKELLADAANLNTENPQETDHEFPYLLAAGERRAFTANTIMRNPEWRRKDKHGALYINPHDAARLNLGEGSTARLSSKNGAVDVVVELTDRMYRGHVSLPNGLGLGFTDDDGNFEAHGTAPNELTSLELRDEYVGTPWQKTVPVRIEAID